MGLGRPEIRLAGSLLQDGEQERLEVLEGAESPDSAMAKSRGICEAARVAQVRMDTDGRVRRSSSPVDPDAWPLSCRLLRVLLPCSSSSWRFSTLPLARPGTCCWGRAEEPRPAEDPELPTDGGQPHSYWLRYGAAVVSVTGEQLRFASEDELLAAHTIPQEALEPPYARRARNYVDLRLAASCSRSTRRCSTS